MDGAGDYMENTITVRKAKTRILASHFHTPSNAYRQIFHAVLRAGHVRLAPDYKLESWSYPGHDLILSLSGAGTVRIGRRTFKIGASDFVWIDYSQHNDVSWPGRSEAWEFVYVHVDSKQLDLVARALNVYLQPVTALARTFEAASAFKEILRLMSVRPPTLDAALHPAIGSLVSVLFAAKAATPRINELGDAGEAKIAGLLDKLRREANRPWRVSELAALIDLSVPQLFRRFKQATGTSPIGWLRQERVTQAKRHLLETGAPIKSIARLVGYSDALYFSRDFKRLVGFSPRDYRLRERLGMT